jgi:hypothetical protein
MAARKFENLLQVLIYNILLGDSILLTCCLCQCAIPVFDGLLPEPHNQQILDLLFVAAHWHSMAKLRMHTDFTLDIMDAATASLGEELRKFNDVTCTAFITRELEREYEARSRRQAKKAAANRKSNAKRSQEDTGHQTAQDLHPDSISDGVTARQHPPTGGVEPAGSLGATAGAQPDGETRRLKEFSFKTYKLHSLGDYSSSIRMYGTTDSYSTEPVSRSESFHHGIQLSCHT